MDSRRLERTAKRWQLLPIAFFIHEMLHAADPERAYPLTRSRRVQARKVWQKAKA